MNKYRQYLCLNFILKFVYSSELFALNSDNKSFKKQEFDDIKIQKINGDYNVESDFPMVNQIQKMD